MNLGNRIRNKNTGQTDTIMDIENVLSYNSVSEKKDKSSQVYILDSSNRWSEELLIEHWEVVGSSDEEETCPHGFVYGYDDGSCTECKPELDKGDGGCNTYTCRTELGGMHEGSDGQRFKKLLNIIGATNIKIKESPQDLDTPPIMGVVYFTFGVYGHKQYNNLETLKEGLGQMMEHEPFLDLHRCWQTLADGTEANEEWYSDKLEEE